MTDERTHRGRTHSVDTMLRVEKADVEGVAEEFDSQLNDRKLVKMSFLQAIRGETTTDELARSLSERVSAELVETRGNTATYH